MKARFCARVAHGGRAGSGAHEGDQGVGVAIYQQLLNQQVIAGFLTLQPQFVATPTPKMQHTTGDRAVDGEVVGISEHENFPRVGILDHDGYQTVLLDEIDVLGC